MRGPETGRWTVAVLATKGDGLMLMEIGSLGVMGGAFLVCALVVWWSIMRLE